jgi:hypothetical protein
MGASVALSPPAFPEFFFCPTTIVPATSKPLPASFFATLQNRAVLHDLLLILRDIATLCTALRAAEMKIPAFFSDVIRTRNTLHHRLLSLPAREFILVADHGFYEGCRLGGLIFNDIVVYPLPNTGVRQRLAVLLRAALTRMPFQISESDHAPTALWIAMLGTIAARSVPDEEAWFLNLLRQLTMLLGLEEWSRVKAFMEMHLWYSPVCDALARPLWTKAVTGKDSLGT